MRQYLPIAGAFVLLMMTPASTQTTASGTPYFTTVRVQRQMALDPIPAGSEPSSPQKGWMIYDSTNNTPKAYDGTQWAQLGGGTTSTGGAVTIVDGGSVTLGSKADTATCATGNTAIACLRQLDADVKGPIAPGTNTIGGVFSGTLTLTALDVSTTASTAQNALAAGHRAKGGFIKNPDASPAALCINEIGAATTGATSGSTICIAAGQSYQLAPSGNAVSVISADGTGGRAFGGYGFQ